MRFCLLSAKDLKRSRFRFTKDLGKDSLNILTQKDLSTRSHRRIFRDSVGNSHTKI
jgi:hypothetical protein